MAGVDKFGAVFAVAFMAAMLGIVGGLSSDDSSFTGSVPVPTQTYSPPPQSSPPETASTPFDDDNLTGVLKYTIRGGIVDSITNNNDENSITVSMDNRLDGKLTITMISDAITSFDDGSYFVTVDGEENHDFVQVGQILTIDFLAGSEEIVIFGLNDNYVSHAASEKAAADAAASEKAAADAAASEKAASEKAASEKAASEKAASEKAAAEKAAAEKAAAEKAVADAAAAEKAAAEKAAAEKAVADAAAAEAAKAPMSVEVYPVTGSGAPGCEPECYDPSTVTISAGGTVTFVNSDIAPHTATSGTAVGGPDGVWDSSLIMNAASYSVTLDNPGTYDYFCMVHPWMQGIVIVE